MRFINNTLLIIIYMYLTNILLPKLSSKIYINRFPTIDMHTVVNTHAYW